MSIYICLFHYVLRHTNLNRETKMTKNGTPYYSVTFPKFKLGEEVVRNVPVAPSYGKY